MNQIPKTGELKFKFLCATCREVKPMQEMHEIFKRKKICKKCQKEKDEAHRSRWNDYQRTRYRKKASKKRTCGSCSGFLPSYEFTGPNSKNCIDCQRQLEERDLKDKWDYFESKRDARRKDSE